MSSTPVEPLETNPERKLYTPKPKQTRVIARYLNGESHRRIAREEGIDRATVSRVLSQEQLVATVAQNQSRLLRMVPKAIDVYEEALDSEHLGIAVATATKLLEGTGVMDKRGLQGTINDSLNRHLDTRTKSEMELVMEPGKFVWPPVGLAPQSEPEGARRKPPKPELPKKPSDDSGSDDDGTEPI